MIGMVIALSGIAGNFKSFLLMLGVVMPPIAAIYVCDFFVLRRGTYEASQLNANAAINWPAFISRLTASGVGFAGTYGALELSRIPAIDSMLTAALIYTGLARFHAQMGRASNDAGAG